MTQKHPVSTPSKTQPTSTQRPARPVRVSCTPRADGSVAVVVRVVPDANSHADRGVFVDFVHAASRRTRGDVPIAVVLEPDRAASDEAPAMPANDNPARVVTTAHITTSEGGDKPVIRTKRIAPAQQLVAGRTETFRGEIILPATSIEGRSWFVRGRFADTRSEGLRSRWVRVS